MLSPAAQEADPRQHPPQAEAEAEAEAPGQAEAKAKAEAEAPAAAGVDDVRDGNSAMETREVSGGVAAAAAQAAAADERLRLEIEEELAELEAEEKALEEEEVSITSAALATPLGRGCPQFFSGGQCRLPLCMQAPELTGVLFVRVAFRGSTGSGGSG